MRIQITVAIVAGLVAPIVAQSAPATPAVTPAKATAAIASAAQAPENAGYTYHQDGRRDPFVSLQRRAPEVERASAGARAPGLAGLGVGEVVLKGTLRGSEGFVAMLLGSDNKTYIVRPGDRLLDGTIRTISADSLIVLQQVDDPSSKQALREVRKTLRQTEEAK